MAAARPASTRSAVDTGAARSSAHWAEVRRVAVKAGVTYLVMTAVLLVAGQMIVGPLRGSSVVEGDNRVVRVLAERRTPFQDTFSLFWSRLADGLWIVAVAVILAVALAVAKHWRYVAMLGAMLLLEIATFLTVTFVIGRDRPPVERLGATPSTGSFPSGHVAATIVVYGFVVFVLSRLGAPLLLRYLAGAWLVVATAAVGWSRMYRGMHHPLDVAAGLLIGITVLCLFTTAVRPSLGGEYEGGRRRAQRQDPGLGVEGAPLGPR